MLVEGVPLRVKLGPSALDAAVLLHVREEIRGAESVLKSTRSLLEKTKAAALQKSATASHECEQEALRYVARKRADLKAFFTAEDVFQAFQRDYLDVVEEERVARRHIEDMYADAKKRAAEARTWEYVMSTKCVFERFTLEKVAREQKLRVLQECSDFLSALRIEEEEERQRAIQQARYRRQEALHQAAARQPQYPQYLQYPPRQPGAMPTPLGWTQMTPPQESPQHPQHFVSIGGEAVRCYLPCEFREYSEQLPQQQQRISSTGFYAAAPGGGNCPHSAYSPYNARTEPPTPFGWQFQANPTQRQQQQQQQQQQQPGFSRGAPEGPSVYPWT
ncbi:uncharacterized protein Tco025E_07363 [Trypanosoma conorhini]|uniref:Uncharacterized protein n=1 Tax=Trypanosoma conorhini TaxID=83891 RepID=A0A422NPP2_9TRYP|nr:uncharacterized protein Tco025E_07363 [Trypanosoma conorhini]RNF07468.1 hypothetical protein Tco025E_07363 [Trypanosoma conorhini]